MKLNAQGSVLPIGIEKATTLDGDALQKQQQSLMMNMHASWDNKLETPSSKTDNFVVMKGKRYLKADRDPSSPTLQPSIWTLEKRRFIVGFFME